MKELDQREKRIFDKLDLDVRGTGGPNLGDVVMVRTGSTPGTYMVGLFEGWDDNPHACVACVLLPGEIVKADLNDIIIVRKSEPYPQGR